jgi:hypothetical protein
MKSAIGRFSSTSARLLQQDVLLVLATWSSKPSLRMVQGYRFH